MKRCLIVDDSRIIRRVARRILEDLVFKAEEVDDGALYLGPDETTAGISQNFRAVGPEIGMFSIDRLDRPVSQSLAVGAWKGASQSKAKESA
jgi:hypothetical protein